jgi:hypothetical protein
MPGAALWRPGGAPGDHRRPAWVGPAMLGVAGAMFLVAILPPVADEARRVEAVQALQFCLFAIGVPALLTLGAPWRLVGLAGHDGPIDVEGLAPVQTTRGADRLAAARHRHREPARSFAFVLLFMVAVVLWRTPVGVDAVVRHPWLVTAEAVTLVGAGVGLWLELVASPPFAPRLTHPLRIAAAALAMWTIWIAAYLVGLSHSSVYLPYHHVPGRELSVWADQALTTGVLWLVSLVAFLPVIFWNLSLWLRDDDETDDALYRLVRDRSHVG